MDTNTQPTIWETPDDLWARIEPVLKEYDLARPKGHRRVNLCRVLNGTIFRLRTGCPWNYLPACFGDDSTVHQHLQQWCRGGILTRIWAMPIEACDVLGGVDWQWQAADTARGKARMEGNLKGRNLTDRGKRGKTEPRGGNGWWSTGRHHRGANVYDTKLLATTPDALVGHRPQLTEERP
jgi:putative transposase